MMRRRSSLICLLPLIILFSACTTGDNDERYPSVVTDYVCLHTDNAGNVNTLSTDNGASYHIRLAPSLTEQQASQPLHLRPDTIYRLIASYVVEAPEPSHTTPVCTLYALRPLLSVIPEPLHLFEPLHTDPAYLQAIWLSGGYLNLRIQLKALDGKHLVRFIDTTPRHYHGKEFTFYHRVIDDTEGYRQTLYASIPLAPFADQLQADDTLRFIINEVGRGLVTYQFAAPLTQHP